MALNSTQLNFIKCVSVQIVSKRLIPKLATAARETPKPTLKPGIPPPPPPQASCNQVFVDPVVLRRDCVSLRRWDPETDGSLEETSWAGAKKVGGTEHVEDEDE